MVGCGGEDAGLVVVVVVVVAVVILVNDLIVGWEVGVLVVMVEVPVILVVGQGLEK